MLNQRNLAGISVGRRSILLGGVALLGGLRTASPARAAAGFEVTRTDEEWRQRLTPEQYRVLRRHGTERAGSSPLDKETRRGTYHCVGCELPLYNSDTKFELAHGLAELLGAHRRGHRHLRGPQLARGPHRGALPPLWRASRPRLRGRP